MGAVVGIDLGTTNSIVAIKKLTVAIIPNTEGEELTPSRVTCLKSKGKVDFIVGRGAVNLSKQYPDLTVKSVKRLMGRDFLDPEVQHIVQNNLVSYKIAADPTGSLPIVIPLLDKFYTPEQISGIILNKLVKDSELSLQDKITDVVVTVPAYFSDRQKFATKVACEQVGLKVLRLLSEPTAAALSFGVEQIAQDELKTIMVFDLGGGTFDISILSVVNGNFMEITKGGDMWLGGDNIDQMLMEHIFKKIANHLNIDSLNALIENLPSKKQLKFLALMEEKVEKLKIALSHQETASLEIYGILKDDQNELIHLEITVTLEEFNSLIKPVITKIAKTTKQILKEIYFEPELIDLVLMVGGSSLIVAIQEELQGIFGKDKIKLHPRVMSAVAEGAAIMALAMTSEPDLNQVTTTQVAAHDYYLQLAEGQRHLLVPRNTMLPFTVKERVKFSDRDQLVARLRILNEIDHILEPVGEIWLHRMQVDLDLEELPQEELELEFRVDENNLITMKVVSLQNQQLYAEGQIARGFLTTKLYNDLEQTLASLISKAKSNIMEINLMLLSNSIVKNILKVCDPITAQVDLVKKQQVERQINTLRLLFKHTLTPFSLYKFVLQIIQINQKYNVLPLNAQLTVQQILTDLESELESLEGIEQFKALVKQINNLTEDFPIIVDLIMAEKTAKIIKDDDPFQSKQILKQAHSLAKHYLNEEHYAMQRIRSDIYDVIQARISWEDEPSRHFVRDVIL